jgi:hypothetical protein
MHPVGTPLSPFCAWPAAAVQHARELMQKDMLGAWNAPDTAYNHTPANL